MVHVVRLVLSAMLLLGFGGGAGATPGDLDPTFGAGGVVTTPLGGGYGTALVLQPDGKLVAAGISGTLPNSVDVVLARYDATGALDPSFGAGGIVTTDFGHDDEAHALVRQADGRLVVAGTTAIDGAGRSIVLGRYNADGTTDAGFGSGGTVTTSIGGYEAANAVVLQPDGRLVAAGQTIAANSATSSNVFVARYNGDGTLDASFGAGGIVITDVGGFDYATGLLRQLDGKLVAVGTSYRGAGDAQIILVRYNTNGSLDTSFGSSGKVTTDFSVATDGANGITLQPDGKLVVAGFGSKSSPVRLVVARYLADGSLDGSFGTDGVVMTPITTYGYGSAILVQSDGKVVVAGQAGEPQSTNTRDALVVRYNPNGSLDGTFGASGIVTVDVGAYDTAAAIVQQLDGKLVTAGSGANGFLLTRLDAGVVLPICQGGCCH